MARKKKAAVHPSHPEFPEKLGKHLSEVWVSEAEAMEREEMDKCIVSCEMTIEATEKDVSDDSKIQDLKEQLKYLNEGYKGVLVSQKAKIKFLLYLMNSRGYDVPLNTDVKEDDEEEE